MITVKYGDKVNWSEGSQMDRMTHKGIVIEVKTTCKVADEDGVVHEVDADDLKRGWSVKE